MRYIVEKVYKSIDFLPVLNIHGDLRKISDYDFVEVNSKIIKLFNVLNTPRGQIGEFPEIGAEDAFAELFYTEKINDVMTKIITRIKTSLPEETIEIDYEFDKVKENCKITITVEGLPGAVKMRVSKMDNYIKIVDFKYIESTS